MNALPLFDVVDLVTGDEADRLLALEVTIERGLTTFVEVGAALLEIRDSRLYRTTHGTFEDYCRDRWTMGKSRAYQLIDAAQVANNLSASTTVDTIPGTIEPTSPILPTTERQARPLVGMEPEEQRIAWQRAIDRSQNGKPTTAHVTAAADEIKQARNGYPLTAANHAVSADPDYDGDEWYTPLEYIEAALP